MKRILALMLACLAVAVYEANGAVTDASIREATKFCESAVPAYCRSTTCPQVCNALRSSARNKQKCLEECTPEKRCKLKPVVGTDDQKNLALDAQNREQLWACIREKRDPSGRRTGETTADRGTWQSIKTPSFLRATRP